MKRIMISFPPVLLNTLRMVAAKTNPPQSIANLVRRACFHYLREFYKEDLVEQYVETQD